MNTMNVNNLRIDIKDIIHPADELAMGALENTPGFEKLVGFISEHGIERLLNVLYKASRLRVTREMSPEYYNMLDKAIEMFGGNIDVNSIDLYIRRSYDCVVEVIGTERIILDLTTAMLENQSDDMLWALFATRVAEVEAKHNKMEVIVRACEELGGIIPSNILTAGIKTAYHAWQRSRIYTEDRAFLLACGDFNYAAAHVLFGQAPPEILKRIDFADPDNIYYKQSSEFVKQEDAIWNTLRQARIFMSADIWRPSRYINLYNWYMSGEYDEIVQRSVIQ